MNWFFDYFFFSPGWGWRLLGLSLLIYVLRDFIVAIITAIGTVIVMIKNYKYNDNDNDDDDDIGCGHGDLGVSDYI